MGDGHRWLSKATSYLLFENSKFHLGLSHTPSRRTSHATRLTKIFEKVTLRLSSYKLSTNFGTYDIQKIVLWYLRSKRRLHYPMNDQNFITVWRLIQSRSEKRTKTLFLIFSILKIEPKIYLHILLVEQGRRFQISIHRLKRTFIIKILYDK